MLAAQVGRVWEFPDFAFVADKQCKVPQDRARSLGMGRKELRRGVVCLESLRISEMFRGCGSDLLSLSDPRSRHEGHVRSAISFEC